MVRRASSGESQPAHVWAPDKKTRTCSKVAGTVAARRRRGRHTYPKNQLLSVSTSDNVGSSPNDMAKAFKDPGLMVMASSTGYTTETLEREDTFLKDWEKPRRVSKHAIKRTSNHAAAASKQAPPSSTKGSAPFVFQKRLARIDWRTLHAIDVDRVTREVDIDTLESVLDTIAFGDIQGEDTRNFTEANFVKIFRLAQLMVEYLLHVQDLLASHKSELLLAGASMQQKGERLRSRYMWQRNALLQTRHDLKQARKTLKAYEVMLKMQEKSQAPLNNQQIRHCPFCEKMFESAYYLEFHISRRHPKGQDVTEEKILAVVSKAEEATAARVKAETSAAVQAEIQQLHEKYQGDLQRAEINANAQVKSLQADLKVSTSQLNEFQNRLELLQSQIRSGSPSKTGRHGLYAVDSANEKYNGPDQERLFELESKFTGLERQVKNLGQENSRLLQELDSAYNEVKELRKENQYVKRSMSKVRNMAHTGKVGDDFNNQRLKASDRFMTSMIIPLEIPQLQFMDAPVDLIENFQPKHINNLVDGLLETQIIKEHLGFEPGHPGSTTSFENPMSDHSKKSGIGDLSGLNDEIPEEINGSGAVDSVEFATSEKFEVSSPPVHHNLQHIIEGETGIIVPLREVQLGSFTMLTDMVEEDPAALMALLKERQESPRERWTREPEKDQALLALARPTLQRRKRETSAHIKIEEREWQSSPEHEGPHRHSISPFKGELKDVSQQKKYESSPERNLKGRSLSHVEKPRALTSRMLKEKGQRSLSTVEEMRAQLDRDMAAAHEEEKRRQKAVTQLLKKELEKEKLEKRKGKRIRQEDNDSGRQRRTAEAEYSSESIAPLLAGLHSTESTKPPPSSTIHMLRKIASKQEEAKGGRQTSKPGTLRETTRAHPFASPPPYFPQNESSKTSLQTKARTPSEPARCLLTEAALVPPVTLLPSNSESKARRGVKLNSDASTSHSVLHNEDQIALALNLGKYFPISKNISNIKTLGVVSATQKLQKPAELKTKFSKLPQSHQIHDSEDDSGKKGMEKVNKKVHNIQEIAEVAAMDVGEEVPTIPIPEKQKWLSEHPYVPISTLPHVLAKYPHPEGVFEETHEKLAHQFDEQITDELRKFGINPDASGISDTAYSSVTAALEKQRLQRMSQVHGNDRRLMEYERGAIIWHTQRAVHDRDTKIIESQFNVATDCSSAHETDANVSGDSNDDVADGSKYNSSGSHQSDRSYELDDLKITKPQNDHMEQHTEHNPRGDTDAREQSSAENSESTGNQSEQSVEVPHRKKNLTKSNLFRSRKAQSRVRPGSRTPPENRAPYGPRSFSWKPKGRQEKLVKVIQDPPSRGELIIPPPKKVDDVTRDEREEVDGELGLGEWESDEEAPQTRTIIQRRVKIDARETASSLKGNGDVFRDLSPPKDISPTKLSLLYEPAENQSILRSSRRSSPSKSSPQKVSSAQTGILEDENVNTTVLNCKGRKMENTNDSEGSEETKMFNELTSEIDDIISL